MSVGTRKPALRPIRRKGVALLQLRSVSSGASAFLSDEEGLCTFDFAIGAGLICVAAYFLYKGIDLGYLAFKRWAIYGYAR